ncbi:Nephrocystin-3 [Hondaea fermentalgiana]|uniref:Nephrocystin-3 n=1 Tax=Hondaea fermentalgiana TaxID=2315210 RepID=A0A2R5G7N4_9STRA|nr:Nephrocystin-3 [Hondaea fermentalgiana]|eukprot:GBG25808.1 Nephrocystin-3 [Hondaea fermentalgiana]
MAQALEQERIARNVRLAIATRDAKGIREGDTISWTGYLFNGKITGVNLRTKKSVTMRQEHLRMKRRREWTMRDVRDYVIPEAINACFMPRPRFFVHTLRAGLQTGPERGGAFVIHARDANFRDLINAALQFFASTGEPLDAQYLWFDEFGTTGKDLTVNLDYLHLIRGAMNSFTYRLVFIESWEEMGLLRRLWCLWEAASAHLASSYARSRIRSNELRVLPMSTLAADRELINLLRKGRANLLVDRLTARQWLEVASCRADAAPAFRADISKRFGDSSFSRACSDMVRQWILHGTRRILMAEKVYTGGISDGYVSLLNRVASLHGYCDSFDQGRSLFQEALEVVDVLHGPASLALARTQRNFAALEDSAGKIEEAQSLLKDALQSTRQTAETVDDGTGDAAMRLEAFILFDLGDAYERDGAHAFALEALEEALALWQKDFDPMHEACAPILCALATVYTSTGDYDSAMDCLATALDIYKPVASRNLTGVISALDALARLQLQQGDLEGALQNRRAALGLLQRSRGRNAEVALSIAKRELAALLLRQSPLHPKEREEAEILLDQAFAVFCTAFGPDHLETRRCYRLKMLLARSTAGGPTMSVPAGLELVAA